MSKIYTHAYNSPLKKKMNEIKMSSNLIVLYH